MPLHVHDLKTLRFAVVLALLGCGGGGEHAEHPHHERGEGKGHDHHREMSPALKSFHDLLSPVYHAEKGPGRADKACAEAASMNKAAGGVASEDLPGATSRGELSQTLTKTVADLEAACSGDKAGVEPALEKVHDAFHAFLKNDRPHKDGE